MTTMTADTAAHLAALKADFERTSAALVIVRAEYEALPARRLGAPYDARAAVMRDALAFHESRLMDRIAELRAEMDPMVDIDD
jgi:hypothetical protein